MLRHQRGVLGCHDIIWWLDGQAYSMVSTKGRYALRMMIDIAKQGPEVRSSLREASQRQQISIKYLEQLASPMVSSGLLKSIRGPHGGYLLGKEASCITAADIVSAAEGNLAPVACLLNKPNGCPRKDECETIEFWSGLQDVVTDYMAGITLADLVHRNDCSHLNSDTQL